MKQTFEQRYPVTADSRAVLPGGTFVAVEGFKENGLDFITDALARGAQHIIVPQGKRFLVEQECLTTGATIEEVADTRKELALRVAAAYGHPAKKVKIIGVTGTKGKTTTTHLIYHLLKTAGIPVALIGGVGCRISVKDFLYEEKSSLTTPCAEFIHAFLARAVEAGVEVVVLELSAHAAALGRSYGLLFQSFAFTNFFPDHLDFFSSLEDYFQAKSLFIKQLDLGAQLVATEKNNWFDRLKKNFYDQLDSKKINSSYYHEKDCSFYLQLECDKLSYQETPVTGITLENLGSASVALAQYKKISCPALFGAISVPNILMALALADNYGERFHKKLSLNERVDLLTQGFSSFPGVPGRLWRHRLKSGALGFVDFAHNGASAQAILASLRPHTDHLIVLFGCGGHKDRSRRSGMAQAVGAYADEIIITNDNPRFENPAEIVTDILSGIPDQKRSVVTTIYDRAEAIATAVTMAHAGSFVVLLGKGHEEEQIIGDNRFFFSDTIELSRY